MRVRVDRDTCEGHGMCTALAPGLYRVNESGFNEMGEFEVPAEQRAEALRGASACPERAISALDDNPA